MKKLISLALISILFSGCSIFSVHKRDIVQGNIITQEEVSRLHTGMTTSQVKDVMGNPVLENIFTANRIEYVYTFKEGYKDTIEKRLTLIFKGGRLKEIEQR